MITPQTLKVGALQENTITYLYLHYYEPYYIHDIVTPLYIYGTQ